MCVVARKLYSASAPIFHTTAWDFNFIRMCEENI